MGILSVRLSVWGVTTRYRNKHRNGELELLKQKVCSVFSVRNVSTTRCYVGYVVIATILVVNGVVVHKIVYKAKNPRHCIVHQCWI